MSPLDFLRTPEAGTRLGHVLAPLDERQPLGPDVASGDFRWAAAWRGSWARVQLLQPEVAVPSLSPDIAPPNHLDEVRVFIGPRSGDSYVLLDNGSTVAALRLLSPDAPNLTRIHFLKYEEAARSCKVMIGPDLVLWTRQPAPDLVSGVIRLFTIGYEALSRSGARS